MAESPQLAELTTIALGGPARRYLPLSSPQEVVDTAFEVWDSAEPWLVLGGGSNLVVADDGFDGTVLHVRTTGIELLEREGDSVLLRVQAGESWDRLVSFTVDEGLAGIEALSGIPGSVGAAPVQNIGAYGQELSATLESVEFADYLSGSVERLTAADLELGYRTSSLKRGREGIIVSVDLRLTRSTERLSEPIAYPQLSTALGVSLGDRVPLESVRATVLALRASKGMVLDPADPDSVSCGSFFTNPIVGENFARSLPPQAPRWLVGPEPADVAAPLGEGPAIPAPPPPATEPPVKLSAAWLIENAGIGRGFRLPGSRAAISSKHSLAVTNTGGATAAEIGELARYIRARVLAEFGVLLQPEPNLIGIEL